MMSPAIRRAALVFVPLLVVLAFLPPIMVLWWQDRLQSRSEIRVTCLIFENQARQLEALQQIRRELGLPGVLVIPEVPAECHATR